MKHTKNQRKRLFKLARLLDKVPPKRFNITEWFSEDGDSVFADLITANRLKNNECGFAGCAMGWGLTDKYIRGLAFYPLELLDGLGFCSGTFTMDDDEGTALFGPERGKVTPKRVAKDIRSYLKNGKLPT